MTEKEMQHLERITNLCIERGTIIEGLEMRIAELEAANTLLNNTFNVQLKVIREHQAADVIAVEAIRSQAEQITELQAALDKITKTAVTLGSSQSAWEQWRICGKIANQALGRG